MLYKSMKMARGWFGAGTLGMVGGRLGEGPWSESCQLRL